MGVRLLQAVLALVGSMPWMALVLMALVLRLLLLMVLLLLVLLVLLVLLPLVLRLRLRLWMLLLVLMGPTTAVWLAIDPRSTQLACCRTSNL